ncbi:MAG: hypothetical protein KDA29_04000 [Phycisphaerales bacterium]|nr:hypothetical protein [Phycisphaerales bacterium]
MDRSHPQTQTQTETHEPKHDAEHIAVSAEQLAQLIRSGRTDDLNELIRHALQERHAA